MHVGGASSVVRPALNAFPTTLNSSSNSRALYLCAPSPKSLLSLLNDRAQAPRTYRSSMSQLLPFRDINVHASAAYYSFSSPSTPSAPTLVVERPTGDIRLRDGALLGTQRVSSIAGILGMIQLKLGMTVEILLLQQLTRSRQVHHCHYKSTTNGPSKRTHGIQGHCY